MEPRAGAADEVGAMSQDAQQVLESTAAPRRPLPAYTLALVSLVQGTGRTTLAAQVAHVLRGQGRSSIAVELDPSGGLARHFDEAFACPARPAPRLARRSAAPRTHVSFDAVLAAPGGALAPLLGADVQQVLLDAPGQDGPWLRAALALADEALVVLTAEEPAWASLPRTEALLAAAGFGPGGTREAHYLVNRFDGRRPTEREVLAALRGALGGRLLPHVVQADVALPEALAHGRPLQQEAADSQALADVERLAEWVSARAARGVRRAADR